MWKFLGTAFLLVTWANVHAAEVQGGVCFPKTADEIVQFMQQGQCGKVVADEWQSKGFGEENKGIGIASDRAAVLFEFDSSALSPTFYHLLDEWGAALKLLGDARFVIQGHTDNVGSERYNFELSQKRAQEVLTYLVNKHGVEAWRLSVQGLGKTSPLKGSVASQSDEERYWNRRVEFLKQ